MAILHGTPQAKLESSTLDEKGKVTYTVSQVYVDRSKPPAYSEMAKAVSKAGLASGLRLVGAGDEQQNGVVKRTARFEGIAPKDPNDPKQKENPDAVGGEVITVSSQLSEAPIATHPNIEVLIEKYGGVKDASGNVTFPNSKMPEAGGGGINGSGSSSANGGATSGRPNPLYGVTTYKVSTKTASKKWIYKGKQPPSQVDNAGKIVNPGPTIAITGSPGEEWLCAAVNVNGKGDFYEVEEVFISSGPAGFNKDLWQSKK